MRNTILILLIGALTFPALADDGFPEQAFVEVEGEGVLHVKPDYIEVRLTVNALAKDGAAARRSVDSKIIAVAKILQQLKVPSDSFESYQLSVEEESDYVDDKWIALGYRATRRAKLTIHDLDRAQEIMDALIEAPIELLDGITAHVNNVDELRKKAKTAAFEDAKRRAENYAKLANRSLGKVYRIGDEVRWDTNMISNITVTGAAISQGRMPIFNVGDIEVKQQVRVIYLLD